MATLTPKQERFAQEYLLDLDPGAAYRRAGYSVKTDKAASNCGLRLLENVGIAAAIQAAQAARQERVELSQDYVVTNLVEVVERCMQRAAVMVREGRELVQATDDEGRHVWTFNAKDAVAALGKLGQHLGMFAKKVEHSGSISLEQSQDLTKLSDEQLAQLDQQLADKGADRAGTTPPADRAGAVPA